jgi:acylphosphatase
LICEAVVQNLPDGRVKVVAEGGEADLERFASALAMKNALIEVTDIEKGYSSPTEEYDGFVKVVNEGETDVRLDSAVIFLKELVDLIKEGLGKQDQMLGKQDRMLAKQDVLIEKQDELLAKVDEAKTEIATEVRELRSDLRTHLEDRLMRIEGDVALIKAKIGL